jgi:hypothetical protein
LITPNGNTFASRNNGNPTPFKKSNKNSGNAKHRRRNFLERKPENLEKVLPLFLENGNGEVNIIPRQNGGIRNDRSRTSSRTRGIGFNERHLLSIENILVSFQNFQVYAQEMVAFEVFSGDNFVS